MSTNKTIKQWLSELPYGYRELALANMNPEVSDDHRESMYAAVYAFWLWSKTPQNPDFWRAVYDHYAAGSPLPPLPVPTSYIPTTSAAADQPSPRAEFNRMLELQNEVDSLRAKNKDLAKDLETMSAFAQSNVKYEERVVKFIFRTQGFLLGIGPNHPGAKELLDQIDQIYGEMK